MKKLLVLSLAVLAFIAFTSNIANAQQAPTQPAQVAQDVSKKADLATPIPAVSSLTGNWVGEISSTAMNTKAAVNLKLVQNGSDVQGSYDFRGMRVVVYDVPVKGTFKDGKLEMVGITAVQVSRDPAGGSCDFLGILDEIGQGRDQVAGFCCPD